MTDDAASVDAAAPAADPQTAADFGFEADVARLLELMTHSVYSERDVFLRELVSNAADACEKLRYEALSDEKLAAQAAAPLVTISLDQGEAHADRRRQWRRHVARGADQRPWHHRQFGHARLSRQTRKGKGRRLHRPVRRRLLFRLHGRRPRRGRDAARRPGSGLAVEFRRQGLLSDRGSAARRGARRRRPRHAASQRRQR